jgi:hypothetical protein
MGNPMGLHCMSQSKANLINTGLHTESTEQQSQVTVHGCTAGEAELLIPAASSMSFRPTSCLCTCTCPSCCW